MSGGASLWRSQFSEQPDPFAHAGRGAGRGPGWQRASGGGFNRASGTRIIEAQASAVSLGSKGRGDVAGGGRVFHRSDERRVGTEGVSTWTTRWSPVY